MNAKTLLVELFTEELPPKALKKLRDAFAQSIVNGLKSRALLGSVDGAATAAVGITTMYATPRRLAVSITDVLSVAPDQPHVEKLMPVSVGLDKDGKATQALIKKLAAKNLSHIDVAILAHESDGKAEQLVYRDMAKGQTLHVGLQAALDEAIANLPVPKVMTYQLADGVTSVQFVRPAHGLLTLHGGDVVPVSVLGLTASNITHGHRFQGAADIMLDHADEYESKLETEGGVIASFEKRRHEIERLLFERAEEHGTTLGEREDYVALLDEVTALVERPTVYAGSFETEFLEVPPECLILTMKLNQKYFPLFHADGSLSSRFLIVSNMRLHNPHNIIEGNQRVVRPRLSDARFFFETDKKTKLADRVPKLANVVYHNKLGNQLQRIERVQKLAGQIATLIGLDSEEAERAAYLAKADLLTDMVGEFPELQGTMGRYYALNDGETAQIAYAIEDHYKPRFAGDCLPRSQIGLVVALADKLETLTGLFGVGQLPTGDKDPFALRRHGLGIMRILIETKLTTSLEPLLKAASGVFSVSSFTLTNEQGVPVWMSINWFLQDRAKSYLKELGFPAQNIEAVVQLTDVPYEYLGRLQAVSEFLKLPEALELAESDKRIRNIIFKSGEASDVAELKEVLFHHESESKLFRAAQTLRPQVDALIEHEKFGDALILTAQLHSPVRDFFRDVMVNDNNPIVRDNRFALLHRVSGLLNTVANLSKLAA